MNCMIYSIVYDLTIHSSIDYVSRRKMKNVLRSSVLNVKRCSPPPRSCSPPPLLVLVVFSPSIPPSCSWRWCSSPTPPRALLLLAPHGDGDGDGALLPPSPSCSPPPPLVLVVGLEYQISKMGNI